MFRTSCLALAGSPWQGLGHNGVRTIFSSGIFSSDIFSFADFRPAVFRLAFFRLAVFRLAYYRLTIFRLGIFSSYLTIFRLCIVSFVHFFVRVFFRPYIFSFVYFFVRTFFRSYIFSSVHIFVHADFRPRRISSVIRGGGLRRRLHCLQEQLFSGYLTTPGCDGGERQQQQQHSARDRVTVAGQQRGGRRLAGPAGVTCDGVGRGRLYKGQLISATYS